ncbi:MAG TPA: hypothetical protein VIX80_01570 [Candidatus Kapabacteria bacterium]
MRKVVVILSLIFCTASSYAQEGRLHHVRLILGGGYGFRLGAAAESTNEVDISTTSPAAMLRVMWKPEHLVSVGIETGYIPVSQANSKGQIKPGEVDGNAQLTAIPAMVVFSMEKYNVELAAGIGMYSLQLYGKSSKNIVVENSALEMGYMFSGAYSIPMGDFSLGLEIKYYGFTDRDIAMLIPNLRLRWNMFTY